MITLGSRSFAGPYMAPLWSAPRAAGVYAVMAPGWRLLTFRALDFDHAENLAEAELLKKHPKYREWLTIVGTQWNLYIATHEMALSTPSERNAVLRDAAQPVIVLQQRQIRDADRIHMATLSTQGHHLATTPGLRWIAPARQLKILALTELLIAILLPSFA